MIRPTTWQAAVASICAAVLLISGCGNSARVTHASAAHAPKPTPPPVCSPQARAAMAGFLGVAPTSVLVGVSTGNNAMPQCSFKAHAGNGRRLEAIANIDSGPQAYFVLERTAIEQGQQFGAKRLIALPQAVTGLGLEADWFPNNTQLMATDGIRLITVTINWRRTSQARQRALAETVARRYLKSSAKGRSRAKGHP